MSKIFVVAARFHSNKIQGDLFGAGRTVAKYFMLMDNGQLVLNHPETRIEDLPEDRPILVEYTRRDKPSNTDLYFKPVTKPTLIYCVDKDNPRTISQLLDIVANCPSEIMVNGLTLKDYEHILRCISIRPFKSEEQRTDFIETLQDILPDNHTTIDVSQFERFTMAIKFYLQNSEAA